MNHWMFRCKDVSRKISLSMDITLPLHHRLAIRLHLMMCRHCARFKRQLASLRAICHRIDSAPLPSDGDIHFSAEAKSRLKAKLRSLS